MESELVTPTQRKKAYEIFQEALPVYLSIGMSYDEFYNKDCCLVQAYMKAHQLKQKYNNTNMWIQGLYFYDVLCRVSPIYNIGAKAGTKPIPYIEEPYALNEEEQRQIDEKKAKAEMDKMKAQMEYRASIINKRFSKGGEDSAK